MDRKEQIKQEIERLKQELKEIELQEKPYHLVIDFISTWNFNNGETKVEHIHRESNHKTEKLAMDRIKETMATIRWIENRQQTLQWGSQRFGRTYTEINFTLNGKRLIYLKDLSQELDKKGIKHLVISNHTIYN